ncbi:MAG: hypothetical protein ACI8S6_000011 [Myxococcota bacterium]|jgi:hypothetical protein
MELDASALAAFRLRHLPLIREALDELGILQVVEAALPEHPDATVSDAECLLVMILNILHGRCALYWVGEWLDRFDEEVLIGKGCPTACRLEFQGHFLLV